MTREEFRDSSAGWYLGLHKEADTTEDVAEARALYNERIRTLEEYNKLLELELMLLHMEEQVGLIDGIPIKEVV